MISADELNMSKQGRVMGLGGPTTSVLSQFSSGPWCLMSTFSGGPHLYCSRRGARLHVVVVVTYDTALPIVKPDLPRKQNENEEPNSSFAFGQAS